MIIKDILSKLVLFSLTIILKINADKVSPSVIILGAGASGISAASKLFQNGFKNVKILEAENRVGGRIYTTQFKNYQIDLGAQWIHGEDGNLVYEMTWPLGLIKKGNGLTLKRQEKLFASSGILNQSDVDDFYDFYYKTEEKLSNYALKNKNISIGKFFINEFNEYFDVNPNFKENKKGLFHLLDMMQIAWQSSDSWLDISTTSISEYHSSAGDCLINWRDRGYDSIIDILIKRYPNPEEELPVLNNTILNTEVTLIDYSDQNGKIVVKTENEEYIADHIIVTCSLGVLKDKHQSLFKPALPKEKQKTIQELGFGNVGKIFLSFEEAWWSNETEAQVFDFFWNNRDFEMILNEPEKNWLLGLVGFETVAHKPKLLEAWLSGNYSREMENLSDEQVLNHCTEVLQRFLGNIYNITAPTGIIRTIWSSNKNFRGTYSFRSMKSDAENVWAETLAEPIDEKELKILFAGEATSPHHFGTVHGAIETGHREANRLIEFYTNLTKN